MRMESMGPSDNKSECGHVVTTLLICDFPSRPLQELYEFQVGSRRNENR